MKYAVIGDPVSHSLSPVMHQVNFKSLNMEHIRSVAYSHTRFP